jgi:hypothetical protein
MDVLLSSTNLPCLLVPWMIWTILGMLLSFAGGITEIVETVDKGATGWDIIIVGAGGFNIVSTASYFPSFMIFIYLI